jgi:hypothetical protein
VLSSRPQGTAATADVEKKAGENKANFEDVIAAATILDFTVIPRYGVASGLALWSQDFVALLALSQTSSSHSFH